MLTSLLDHGFVASTITAARYVASGNPQFVPAVAGGLLAAGSNTLSPEHSYTMLARAVELRQKQGGDATAAAGVLVDEFRAAGKRLPGFGHPIHKNSDFRADVLFQLAQELGIAGDGIAMFQAIKEQFVQKTGKTSIPINVDGALASVGWDLGWRAEQTVAIALLSVLPGLMGHVVEELQGGKPLRYIKDGKYTGASLTPLPENYGHGNDGRGPA
jgi:citrate synthase